MNSQRGKASTKASTNVKTTKTVTYGSQNKQKKSTKKRRSNRSSANSSSSVQPSFRDPTSVAVSYSAGAKTRGPRISRSSLGESTIENEELFFSVNGTVNFSSTKFSINPGLAVSFPWLSSQAKGWDRYRFNYLRLCSYTRAPSTTSGSLMFVPDYDASDDNPDTEQQASSYYGTVEDAPWKNIVWSADPSRLGTRFVRTSSTLPLSSDIKLYDTLNMFIATSDSVADGQKWAKLWWEYSITFYDPQTNRGGSADSATMTSTGVPTALLPASPSYFSNGNFPINFTGNQVTIDNLVSGHKYLLQVGLVGGTLTDCRMTALVGAANITDFQPSVQNSDTIASHMIVIQPNNNQALFTWTIAGAVLSRTYLYLALLPTDTHP